MSCLILYFILEQESLNSLERSPKEKCPGVAGTAPSGAVPTKPVKSPGPKKACVAPIKVDVPTKKLPIPIEVGEKIKKVNNLDKLTYNSSLLFLLIAVRCLSRRSMGLQTTYRL